MSQELIDKIKDVVTDKLGVEADKIVPEAKFLDDLGADSLDLVELIMALEETFDIEIPDEDAEKIVKVGDAISYIENKTN